jgi:hypothetical protein
VSEVLRMQASRMEQMKVREMAIPTVMKKVSMDPLSLNEKLSRDDHQNEERTTRA